MNRNTYLTLNIPDKMKREIVDIITDSRVRAMAKESLHITFLFCGDLLHKISNNNLVVWNMVVSEMIKECKNSLINIKSLTLFPPDKQNLIIAKLNVDQDLIDLQKKIVTYTDSLGGIFSEIALLNKDWLPHITLGKLQAKKSEVVKIGMEIINHSAVCIDEYKSECIEISGMMPIRLGVAMCNMEFGKE